MRYPSVTVITLATVGATLAGSAINSRFFEFPKTFGAMLALGLGMLCFAVILYFQKKDPPKR
jgi:xanthine/uracil permease